MIRAPHLALLPVLVLAAIATGCRTDAATTGVQRTIGAPCAALLPLTQVEVDEVRSILAQQGELAPGRRIVTIELDEPAKAEIVTIAAGSPSAAPVRRAIAVVHDRTRSFTAVLTVDVGARAVLSRDVVPFAQPMMGEDDFRLANTLVRSDPRWQAAMRKRGITDFDAVYLDPWAPGAERVAGAEDSRLARVLASFRGDQANDYGPPIEGVVAVVDLTHERVVEVTDTTVAPLSTTSTDFFDPRVRGAMRGAGHPVEAVQRGGSTARVSGNAVEWEGWSFVWSFHDREGLVLHDVRCDGRTILHRASISEMWVPYGDPDANWAWRNAFDEGEYGLGNSAHDLVPGREVPANALLFPDLLRDRGELDPQAEGVVALWEQDAGILWSHDGAETLAIRARELALGFVCTVGNYDYAFRWVLALDGSIRFETDLTGILLTKGSSIVKCGACDAPPAADGSVPDGDERYGTLVADRVVAVHHQHFVALRLDFDIDGRANSVRECDVEPDPDARRRGRNGWVARRTTLRSESVAMRDADAGKQRRWEVFNPASRTSIGHQRGYTIVPGATAVPYATADSPERALARFADHVLWVTRCHERERFAAGDWPSQARAPGGLPVYVQDDEPLTGQDVVVWYVIGITHVPRPEDYPVMPAAHASVSFVPTGFFERNPALGR